MRPETIIMTILSFLLVFTLVNGLVYDVNQNYASNIPENNINKSYFSDLNNDLSTLNSQIKQVGDTKGWAQIISGASAFWLGISTTAKLMLKSPLYITRMISDSFNIINPPSVDNPEYSLQTSILPLVFLIVDVFIIFMIINFVRGGGSQV